jgi:hypothetical protein
MMIRPIVNLLIFNALIIAMMPPISKAEHKCVEEIEDGSLITATKRLPPHWFLIGGKLISDKAFHTELGSKFKENYSESFDEGYNGIFCALKDGVYLNISNGDYGAWAEYSTQPAKCWKCIKTSVDIGYLVSGTGLIIGMSKKEASQILGYKINADTTSIVFEEIKKTNKQKIQHSQKLRLAFRINKLFSFSIDDNRETYK